VHRFWPETTLVVPRNAPHQIINIGTARSSSSACSRLRRLRFFPDGQPIELPWTS
jgi:hypothetical protein